MERKLIQLNYEFNNIKRDQRALNRSLNTSSIPNQIVNLNLNESRKEENKLNRRERYLNKNLLDTQDSIIIYRKKLNQMNNKVKRRKKMNYTSKSIIRKMSSTKRCSRIIVSNKANQIDSGVGNMDYSVVHNSSGVGDLGGIKTQPLNEISTTSINYNHLKKKF